MVFGHQSSHWSQPFWQCKTSFLLDQDYRLRKDRFLLHHQNRLYHHFCIVCSKQGPQSRTDITPVLFCKCRLYSRFQKLLCHKHRKILQISIKLRTSWLKQQWQKPVIRVWRSQWINGYKLQSVIAVWSPDVSHQKPLIIKTREIQKLFDSLCHGGKFEFHPVFRKTFAPLFSNQ